MESCPACKGEGEILLTSCPNRLLDPEIPGICDLIDLMDAGHRPVAGGALDQTDCFLGARRYLKNEDARWQLAATKGARSGGR